MALFQQKGDGEVVNSFVLTGETRSAVNYYVKCMNNAQFALKNTNQKRVKSRSNVMCMQKDEHDFSWLLKLWKEA